MKTRNLVSLVLVICMLMGLGSAVARAEGDIEGDIYTLNNEDYPTRHWKLMNHEEFQAFIEKGWKPNTGVLIFKKIDGVMTYVGEVNVDSLDKVQDLYNEGYCVVVLYNWLHDGESLGKHTEQSVSVGYWVLDTVQAAEFFRTYQVPELFLEEEAVPTKGYYSSWYLDGQSAMDPSGEESRLVLDMFSFVREEYDVYDRGYGEQVVLKNGNTLVYTFDEAVAAGGFDDELWPLK